MKRKSVIVDEETWRRLDKLRQTRFGKVRFGDVVKSLVEEEMEFERHSPT